MAVNTPEQEARQFERAMEHVRKAYVSINSIFGRPNKIDHLIDAHTHISSALKEIGPDILEECLEDRRRQNQDSPPPPLVESEGNMIKINFAPRS